ncbi:MAG: NADH-quinone oxidoreductase subunit L [Holophagales bacterium]|jgi:NADH-quinone oxidoreductase subunit L|nr:NADH-quinone oxidoreductase subunit L [Holophagales bacterium]
MSDIYYWMIPLLPLLGAAINGLLGKRFGKTFTSAVALGSVLGSLVLAIIAFVLMKAAPGQRLEICADTWINAGSLSVPFGLVFDPLSGLMSLVVTGIGFLIHIYSVGYMGKEEGYARYFSYLNLFIFFMLTLVLGSSLPLVFVGWEGVGLCSYLLIGYYYKTDYAPGAGLKAFLTNRVGDLGMVIGMMTLFAAFGTLTIGDILVHAGGLSPEAGFGVLTFATLMVFIGAAGKSAQIPLYIWLPDAMAGPTPVSALIHAATMVTSGIVLLCRLAPLFQLAPITMNAVAWVGAATAIFAATIGLLQRDIKKVLAYSTVSQLGYMFLGLGAAGFAAGFFHVFTHAWFKALLFLGAGSVITAMHHEQDLFKMGGLKEKMPITFWTMLIATLCIIGFPGTSGFASKDEILYLAFLKSPVLWVIGVLGACCTAFYMLRLLTLAFWGKPRDIHAFRHARESHATMTAPLVVLAVGSILAVGLGWPEAFGGSFAIGKFLSPSIAHGQIDAHAAHHGSHGLAWGLALISTIIVLGAAWFGWKTYKDGLTIAEARASRMSGLHKILFNKYYVDEAIERLILAPVRCFGQFLFKRVDVTVIDGVGINLPAALTRMAGDFVTLLQTGRVRNYILTMGLGTAALIWLFLK